MDKNRNFIYIWIVLQSLAAGYLNIATITLFNNNTSHHTGNLSKLVISLYSGDLNVFSQLFFIIILFVIGSIVSGLLFHNKQFILRNRYGALLIILGMGYILIYNVSNLILFYTVFLLGLQNSMFIFYKDVLVRTTHFSGYLSDIGFTIGRIIRGYKEDISKMIFYLINIVGFLLGGYVSLKLIDIMHYKVFLLAGIYYAFLGCYYFVFRKLKDNSLYKR